MTATFDPTGTLARCRACGAAAAADQRYCLSCGTRREDVPDPVSRYLIEASAARARVAAAAERRARAAGSRRLPRLPRLSPALATVLVVFALLVGVEIGHSTSSRTSGSTTSTTRSSLSTSAGQTSSKGSGTSAVDKVATSKGKSYVQQESNLPTSVTP